MKKPIIRTPYSDKPETGKKFPKKGKTKQSFKDECNINTIIAKYKHTGILPNRPGEPHYGEQPSMDFTEVQQSIAHAKSVFEELPEKARGSFASVSDLIDAMADPERSQELIDSGLMIDPNPPQQTQAETATTATTGDDTTHPVDTEQSSEALGDEENKS